jgi:hypothetical protein
MKKILSAAAIIFACLTVKQADAQLHFNVGVNIGSQPEWGPTGYDHADYYYMPDIDAYYDVPAHQYVYYDNNVWMHNRALPPRYSNFDRYHSYKVVVNQRNPWEHQDVIRSRYAGYRGRHDQAIIRESHDNRYRNHWHEDGGHNNDHHDDRHHDDHHDH